MSLRLLAADPALGVVGTLRAHRARLGDATCLLVAARQPVAVDPAALVAGHRAHRAAVTVAVRTRGEGEQSDALIVADDGRVMAVQPSPHPDEALSELADAGVYVVAPEALDQLGQAADERPGGLVGALLEWDAAVYAHPLGD